MELQEALLKRRSVRKFTDEEVSDADIDALMHAAMSGPSAMNKKPWEFYVIKDKEKLEEIKKHGGKWCNYNAPLAIVVGSSLLNELPFDLKDFWIQDCSAAAENILLKAVDLGLGTVWCGVYPIKSSVKNVQKILGIGSTHTPLNIILVGHPAEESEPRDQYNEKRVHII